MIIHAICDALGVEDVIKRGELNSRKKGKYVYLPGLFYMQQ
jgi:hypothetical protein